MDDFLWNVFANICLIIICLKVLLNIYNITITENTSNHQKRNPREHKIWNELIELQKQAPE